MKKEMNEKLDAQIGQALKAVRSQKPLVHHITNYVTVNDCANIVLAIGASPIMADDLDEVEAITSISSALVLNIGTLNKRTIESMVAAGKQANGLRIPVVLDPVGAGASALRNKTTERILTEVKVDVLRGNISEIRFVAGLDAATKGVDAAEADLISAEETGRAIAEQTAKKIGCVTAITGATDIVSDGKSTILLENGTKSLSNITGTGCMCSSLVGAFCGAIDDPLLAAVGGILSLGIAGEIAEENVGDQGNGSFRVAMMDSVSKLDAGIIGGRAKIHEV